MSLLKKSTEAIDDTQIKKVYFNNANIGTKYDIYNVEKALNEFIKRNENTFGFRSFRKNEFNFRTNQPLMCNLLEELVNKEGPIHFDFAVKRLTLAWGIRKNPICAHTVNQALLQLIKQGKVIAKKDFLWPQGLTDIKARYPILELVESQRKIEYICPQELEKGMLLAAQYAIGISSSSLVVETARIFGVNRTGENVKNTLMRTYQKLIRERKLSCKNDIVTIN